VCVRCMCARVGLWGNNEEQCYVDTTDVLQVLNDPDDASDGILAIRAINKKAAVSCTNRMVSLIPDLPIAMCSQPAF
jgi:hypothetical protein